MKKITIFICLFLEANAIFAQQPEKTPPTDSFLFAGKRAIDRFAEVFRVQETSRTLFKWDMLASLPAEAYSEVDPILFSVALACGMEAKVTPSISMVGFFSGKKILYKESFGAEVSSYVWEQRVEPRFYFEMPFRKKAGKQADNMSGNYVGLEYWNTISFYGGKYYAPPAFETAVTLRAGMQRRFFHHGWFDVSIGVGSRRSTINEFGEQHIRFNPWRTIFDPRLGVGLAIGESSPQRLRRIPKSKVFNLFKETSTLRKIDLYGLVIPHPYGAHGRLSLAWEHKIARSPISIELEGAIPYEYTRNDLGYGRYQGAGRTGVGAGVMPRWYILQRFRINNAQSANNLSGLFVGYNTNATIWLYGEMTLRQTPVIGLQHQIFRQGFFAYQFGRGTARERVRYEIPSPGYGHYFEWEKTKHWLSEVRIGLVF